MKTSSQLVDEVAAELNAVKAADMGLEAVGAFALEAAQQFDKGDVVKTKEALVNLSNLVAALRTAVPANVVPATAGPVGKSPKEQFIEQAHEEVTAGLGRLQEALAPLNQVLEAIGKSVHEASRIIDISKTTKELPDA